MLKKFFNNQLTIGTALLMSIAAAAITEFLPIHKQKEVVKPQFAYVDFPPEIGQVTASKDSIDMMLAWRSHDTLHLEFIDDGRVSRFVKDSTEAITKH